MKRDLTPMAEQIAREKRDIAQRQWRPLPGSARSQGEIPS